MQKRLAKLLIHASALLIVVCPAFGQATPDLPQLSAVEREIKGGETHSYRKRLESGQFLHAIVVQEGIDLVTAVFTPDGKQIAESDSPNGIWGSEPILVVAPVAGEYRVEVRAPGSRTGRYKIEILAQRDATVIDKGHVAAQMALDEGAKLMTQQTATAKRTAIEKYQTALPLFQAAGDNYRRAITYLSIGIAYFSLNEFRDARGYFDETLKLSVALGDRRLEASTEVGSSRVDLQACKLEYSIVSPK